jgi:outer membrane protein assembly factor BamB
VVLAVGSLVAVLIGVLASSGTAPSRGVSDGHHPTPSTAHHAGGPATAPVPAVEAGVLPWQLANPISREVVAPAASGKGLIVAGGIEASGTTAAGVFTLDASSGALSQTGSLTTATHDAASASAAGGTLVIGGGGSSVSSQVQEIGAGGTAQALGVLPQPRADASAVSIGGSVYVVGGYDGRAPVGAVLATTDGKSFRTVATLADPVRYPAVAVLAGKIVLFGGLDAAGQPVGTIQEVDPAAGKARTVGTMPAALSGAIATEMGGVVYVAGGQGTGASASGAIWAFDPSSGRMLPAGALPVPVAYAGSASTGGRTYVVGGETAPDTETSDVQMLEPNTRFGTAGSPGAGSPYFGDTLLIADRGNNRLLALDDTGRVIWTYPQSAAQAPAGGFYFPDDAFFARHGTVIISNQEDNHTIVMIAYPSGRVIWSYGHPRSSGYAAGYLNTPDDAYLLPDGQVTVADNGNCRILVISMAKKVTGQIGSGTCAHGPGELGSPNGDTPLANGNLLVSEIFGSYVDEFTPGGHLVWSAKLDVGYPSDPQQLGPDLYLIADYSHPGAIVEFNRAGQTLYRYAPTSGPGELYQPSLVEMLPSGVFMANDDYNDRVVAVDPATGAIVWQYGVTGQAGTGPGMLNTPDGFDILAPGGVTPTHPATG